MLSLRFKHNWIFAGLVLILFTFSHSSFAAAQLQASPALRTIFKQTNDIYFGPPVVNATLNDAFNQAPEVFASTVGMTLQRQKQYVHRHPKYFPQYKKLEEEAESFMRQLARVHHYKHPGDGSPLPAERLLAEFLSGLNGGLNQSFIQKFGINPAQVDLPLMLAQVPPPKNITNNGEMGKLQVKKDTDNLVLLGEKASPFIPESPTNWQASPGTGQTVGRICPDKNKSKSRDFFDIHVKENPIYRTRCVYYGINGPLREQWSYGGVDGKMQGVRLLYVLNRSGQYYLGGVSHYVNGLQQGDALHYSLTDSGSVYLSIKTPYRNGKKNGIEKSWFVPKSGQRYLVSQTPYVDGKREGVQEEYWLEKSGQVRLRTRTPYTNNKINGAEEDWTLSKSGILYMCGRTFYANGRKDGPELAYRLSKSGQPLLIQKYINSNGKTCAQEVLNEKGQKIRVVPYNGGCR